MFARQNSIKQRVRAVILSASAIVLLVTTAAFVGLEIVSFRAELVRTLTTLASVIADNSRAPLAFNNREVAGEILGALRAEPDIVAAALYDAEGNVFAKYPATLEAKSIPVRPLWIGHEFSGRGLVIFTSVELEQKQIGTLYLQSSLRGLYDRLERFAMIVIIVLLGAFGGAFLLSAFLERRISDPILTLTRTAQAVSSQGDYSVRAPKPTDDEIGVLTGAFNQMLDEIQQSHGRLAEQARLLDLSTDAIIVRDMQERIIFWNQGAEEIYGWPREEALGRKKNEILGTQFPEPREQIDLALQRNNRWSGDLIQTRRDGGRIYVSTRWVLDRDADGKPASVLITDNDITLRKRAEEEIRRTLEFNRDIMTAMGEGLYTVDRAGLVTYINPAAERLFGWSLAELRGRKMHDMTHHMHPDGTPFPAEECAGLRVVREGKTLVGHEDVFIRRNGTFFDVVYTSSPIRSEGEITGLVVVFSDVSERKRVQEALAQSARELRLMAELVPGLIVQVDTAKRYVFVNSSYARFFGKKKPEDIVGRSVREVTGEEAYRTIEPYLDQALSGRNVSYEFSVNSPVEGMRHLSVAYVPLQEQNLKVTGLVGLMVDITASKAFEAELERQVQERTAKLRETLGELEAFSYSISHDMRAPLRAMQGYAQALSSDHGDRLDDDGRLYLDRIFRAANRLDLLIQDVLAYSRVAKGDIDLRPVDLERLIDDITSTNPEFQEPKARVTVEKPLHRVLGHEAYLTQCLTNLLDNATKFVPKGILPEVRIRSELHDGKVRVWFEDNGIGIDPLHHERIFQIFGQVYPQKLYGGTGIGLAIVRKAVQRMNGEVGVESGMDKGSRFWLILNEVKT